MALINRLIGRQIYSKILRNEQNAFLFVRPVTLQAKKVQPVAEEGHDERNMRLGRPQSPHLTIYAPQLTSMLSISHRITGSILSAYAVAFGLGALVLPDTIPHYIEHLSAAGIGCSAVMAGKLMLAFPMTYHFWNGIRHLLWDTGKFLTIKEVYSTGYIMLILATISAVGLSAM